jgi:hypothetical protein
VAIHSVTTPSTVACEATPITPATGIQMLVGS